MVRGSPSIQPPGAGPRVHTVFPSKFIHAWPTLTSMNEYDEQSGLHRMDLLNQHCSSGPIDKRNKTREREISKNSEEQTCLWTRTTPDKTQACLAEWAIASTLQQLLNFLSLSPKCFRGLNYPCEGQLCSTSLSFHCVPVSVLGLNPISTALFTVCAGHLPDSYHIVHVLFFEIPVFQCLCIYSIYPSIQDSFVFRRGTKFLSFIQNQIVLFAYKIN